MKEPFPYEFKPTAGMPMTSFKEGSGPEKVTWFSTIGKEQYEAAKKYDQEETPTHPR